MDAQNFECNIDVNNILDQNLVGGDMHASYDQTSISSTDTDTPTYPNVRNIADQDDNMFYNQTL